MILLCGIPSESPLSLVNKRLKNSNKEIIVFSQRQIENADIEWKWIKNKPAGKLYLYNCSYNLQDIESVYLRLMDDTFLPEIIKGNEKLKKHSQTFHNKLQEWLEVSDKLIVNKHSQMYSNSSKPYQAQIIRKYGLETPPTLITNDKEEVLAFKKTHKNIIYKSISGIRSIVKQMADEDLDRLDKLKYCPVQFQARLRGYDVRVHVVGTKTFATKIKTTGVDYRYAHKEKDGNTDLTAFEIPEKIKNACIEVSASLGLHFSGIDLRFTPDGKVYCFEVNPMPGYSYYESNTGQPISAALADYLCGTEKILVTS